MARTISWAGLQKGRGRNINEDNLYLLDRFFYADAKPEQEETAASQAACQCYAVADGFGHDGVGAQVSYLAMQVLDQHLAQSRSGRFDFVSFARDLMDLASRSIAGAFRDYGGMPLGTSFSLLMIEGTTAYTLGLGNCPIYLYRDQQLHRLTTDHLSTMPERVHLSRYLGMSGQQMLSENDNLTRTLLEKGDVLLLMSDGLSQSVSEAQISQMLDKPLAFIDQIRRLRDLAAHQGGEDNMSLIGLKVLDPHAVDADQPVNGRRPSRGRPGEKRTVQKKARPAGKQPGQAARPVHKAQPSLSRGDALPPRWLRLLKPFLLYLLFVVLGLLAGWLIFSLPGWLRSLTLI